MSELPNTAAFYLLNVKLIGDALKNKPDDAPESYRVVAYIPDYNGKLNDLTALPYREKVVSRVLWNWTRDVPAIQPEAP